MANDNSKPSNSTNDIGIDRSTGYKPIINIQKKGKLFSLDDFLDSCRYNIIKVILFLINEKEVEGYIECFDDSSIVMNTRSTGQFLVMKSAIVKIMPSQRLDISFSNGRRAEFIDEKLHIDYTCDPNFKA